MDNIKLWTEYTKGKQTYAQLSKKYCCSIKTIQRQLDLVKTTYKSSFPSVVNVLMDTTGRHSAYFGKNFGVVVYKDSLSGTILFTQFVKQETNQIYLDGVKEISRRGIKIQSIICDGRKGLMQLFSDIPIQYCQFHQVKTIRTYLSKKPKLEASKELWEHTLLLTSTDKESFVGGLELWHVKWKPFLDEQKTDENGKRRYVHKKLRSAYRSLKNNLPWLFTWYDNKSLNMPNTTNAIDGHFADLKNKLRNHNGLSLERKKKFINEFFLGINTSECQ